MYNRDQVSISDHYRRLQNLIQEQVLSEKDEVILHANTEELAEYYLAHKGFSPVEFDTDRPQTMEHKKELRVVRAEQREESYQDEGDLTMEYESIVVTMPIIPNTQLQIILSLGSSTYSLSGQPKVSIGEDALSFSIDIKGYQFEYDNNKIAEEVKQKLESLKQWIGWKNNDINQGNQNLKQTIQKFIEERKAKLNSDQSRINALVHKINIPLKQKVNEAATRIKLDPKPLVKKIKPNPKMPEEYVLDHSKVMDVVSIIDNQGRQFEKTPKTYRLFEEESLRDVILVGLNTVFEGKATGETFSYKGKTDIYLNIDKGNVLICECKIWGGSALYNETIDQLLGYLTWRHNFGIVITFVKIKSFSKVLSDISATITSHSTYRSGIIQVDPHHFTSHHVLPQDETKKVEIHHLFYNLYFEK
jgi:hypothetical protein